MLNGVFRNEHQEGLEGNVKMVCDIPIEIIPHHNSSSIVPHFKMGIILNNVNKLHWVSWIPKGYTEDIAQIEKIIFSLEKSDISHLYEHKKNLSEIIMLCRKLQNHAFTMSDKGIHGEKKKVVADIIYNLKENLVTYYSNTSEINFEKWEKTHNAIQGAISQSVEILKVRRSPYLPVIASIVLCLVGIGFIIGAPLALYTRGKRLLFWSNTTTSSAIQDQLSQLLNTPQRAWY